MKFDCGISREEKIAQLKKWHKWYAWFPVRVGSNDCRWLEYVERKGDRYLGWYWEYRASK